MELTFVEIYFASIEKAFETTPTFTFITSFRMNNFEHYNTTHCPVPTLTHYFYTPQIRRFLPNQPHLLNKYQMNMGFSHFHELWILSGMFILAPHQINSVKECGFCNDRIILI